MTVSRTVELEGHIIDSGTMGHCFGVVMDMGGEFEVEEFEVGRHKHAETYCRMRVMAESEDDLRAILHELNQQGATVADPAMRRSRRRRRTGSSPSISTRRPTTRRSSASTASGSKSRTSRWTVLSS